MFSEPFPFYMEHVKTLPNGNILIDGNKDLETRRNEVNMYFKYRDFVPPFVFRGDHGNCIEVHCCKYNATRIPEGYTRKEWNNHILQFYDTIPFCHNGLSLEKIVYDTPDKLYLFDLFFSTNADGSFEMRKINDRFGFDTNQRFTIQHNKAFLILSMLTEEYCDDDFDQFYNFLSNSYDSHEFDLSLPGEKYETLKYICSLREEVFETPRIPNNNRNIIDQMVRQILLSRGKFYYRRPNLNYIDFIQGDGDFSLNEIMAYRENKDFVPEFLETPYGISVKIPEHSALEVPAGWTVKNWALKLIDFVNSLPFLHNDLNVEYIFYNDPNKPVITQLYYATKSSGEEYAPSPERRTMSKKKNKQRFILSILSHFFDDTEKKTKYEKYIKNFDKTGEIPEDAIDKFAEIF